MTILSYIVALLFFLATPALVLWICRRVTILGKIGPIMVLYALGMVVAFCRLL